MTWAEFREYVAICAVALSTAAVIALSFFSALVIAGATIGGAAGAVVWAFQSVAGACK